MKTETTADTTLKIVFNILDKLSTRDSLSDTTAIAYCRKIREQIDDIEKSLRP
jgi:hypothetical protein